MNLFFFVVAVYLEVQNVAICLLKRAKNAIVGFPVAVTILAVILIHASYTSTPPVPPVIAVTLRYVRSCQGNFFKNLLLDKDILFL